MWKVGPLLRECDGGGVWLQVAPSEACPDPGVPVFFPTPSLEQPQNGLELHLCLLPTSPVIPQRPGPVPPFLSFQA